MTTIARVRMWGTDIGTVALGDGQSVASFEYDPRFLASGIQLSPLVMPLSNQVYRFHALAGATFHGLPGMLCDSLPDKFGNKVLDAWLAEQGRPKGSLNPVERLCYTGKRGMGALEYYPVIGPDADASEELDLARLTQLAADILAEREGLQVKAGPTAMRQISVSGTSAGGARAKAVVAWNEMTGVFKSGQVDPGEGFTYWLLKFDGMADNKDKEEADRIGYTRTEYAYYLMARAAGITMNECRLFAEGGRKHFMTRRFDRVGEAGEKLHMQTLGALAHFDFNQAGAYSYEDAVQVMRRLRLTQAEVCELFRRAVFNVMARNQDDHVKNISFLMDKRGQWSLAPAYDLTYAYNPQGLWTSSHQMPLNGKRSGIGRNDLMKFARFADVKRSQAVGILDEVHDAVAHWMDYAQQADAIEEVAQEIESNLALV